MTEKWKKEAVRDKPGPSQRKEQRKGKGLMVELQWFLILPEYQEMKEHPHLCTASEVKCYLFAGSLLLAKSFHNHRIHFNTCGLMLSLGPSQL